MTDQLKPPPPKTLPEKYDSIQRQKERLAAKEARLVAEVQETQNRLTPPPVEEVPATPIDSPPEPPPLSAFERGQIAKSQAATSQSPASRRSDNVKAHFLAGQGGTQFLSSDLTKNQK